MIYIIGNRGCQQKGQTKLHLTYRGCENQRVDGIWRNYTIITDTRNNRFFFLHIAIDYALQIMNINFF